MENWDYIIPTAPCEPSNVLPSNNALHPSESAERAINTLDNKPTITECDNGNTNTNNNNKDNNNNSRSILNGNNNIKEGEHASNNIDNYNLSPNSNHHAADDDDEDTLANNTKVNNDNNDNINDNTNSTNNNNYINKDTLETRHSYINDNLQTCNDYNNPYLQPDACTSPRYTQLISGEDDNTANKDGGGDEDVNKDSDKGGGKIAEFNEVDIYQFADEGNKISNRALPNVPYEYISPLPYKAPREKTNNRKLITIIIIIVIFILLLILALALGLSLGLKKKTVGRTYAAGVMTIPDGLPSSDVPQVTANFISITHNCLNKSSSFSDNFVSVSIPAAATTIDKTRYVIVLTMNGEYDIPSLYYYLTNVCFQGWADVIGYMECLSNVEESYLTNMDALPCIKL